MRKENCQLKLVDLPWVAELKSTKSCKRVHLTLGISLYRIRTIIRPYISFLLKNFLVHHKPSSKNSLSEIKPPKHNPVFIT